MEKDKDIALFVAYCIEENAAAKGKVKQFLNMFQIDQSNLHLIIPGKISWLVKYLQDDYGYSLQECLKRIYHSQLYKKLSTESTKYWHLGPVDLYAELKTEL